MSGILFATEAWHPAGERISECLWYFQTRMNNIDLPLYCDALDTIGIIPFLGQISICRIGKNANTSVGPGEKLIFV